MSKKLILTLSIAAAILVCSSPFVFAKEGVGSLLSEQASKLIEKFNELTPEQAKMFAIDTTGLNDDQIKELVIAKENEAMIAKAKKGGIETEGLTPEQVISKVNERDKELAAKRVE